jgi:hypothetical protein
MSPGHGRTRHFVTDQFRGGFVLHLDATALFFFDNRNTPWYPRSLAIVRRLSRRGVGGCHAAHSHRDA